MRKDKYGLRALAVGQSIVVESRNRHLWSYLANRGDVLNMTLKGHKLGGGRWIVTRIE